MDVKPFKQARIEEQDRRHEYQKTFFDQRKHYLSQPQQAFHPQQTFLQNDDDAEEETPVQPMSRIELDLIDDDSTLPQTPLRRERSTYDPEQRSKQPTYHPENQHHVQTKQELYHPERTQQQPSQYQPVQQQQQQPQYQHVQQQHQQHQYQPVQQQQQPQQPQYQPAPQPLPQYQPAQHPIQLPPQAPFQPQYQPRQQTPIQEPRFQSGQPVHPVQPPKTQEHFLSNTTPIQNISVPKQDVTEVHAQPASIPNHDYLYKAFVLYFENAKFAKINDANENYALYYARVKSLLSNPRYLIVITKQDYFPKGYRQNLGELEWISFQLRTLNKEFPCPEVSYRKENNGIFDDEIILQQRDKLAEKVVYQCKYNPLMIELLPSKKGSIQDYPDKSTLEEAMDSFQCVIYFS